MSEIDQETRTPPTRHISNRGKGSGAGWAIGAVALVLLAGIMVFTMSNHGENTNTSPNAQRPNPATTTGSAPSAPVPNAR